MAPGTDVLIDDEDRVEFNEIALAELGVSMDGWQACGPGERIALVARWFRDYPPRTRRQACEFLGVTRAQWDALGSKARSAAAQAVRCG
jgi:hypothetical protein